MTGNCVRRRPNGPALATVLAPIALALLLLALGTPIPAARAGGIQVSVRVPAATDAPRHASTALLVTTAECHTAKNLSVVGRAEGLVDGKRRSLALTVRPGQAAGEFEVAREWPAAGRWVLVFEVTAWDHTRTMVVDLADAPTGAPLRVARTAATWKAVGEKEVQGALRGQMPKDTAGRSGGIGDTFARALGF